MKTGSRQASWHSWSGLLRWTAWDSIVCMDGPHKRQSEVAAGRGRNAASNWLAFGIGLALLAAIVAGGLRESSDLTNSKVTVGTKDEVYYSHAATKEDARVLGQALKTIGFFDDRGTSVFLSKGKDGTVVSFVLKAGAWKQPGTVLNFEEIGRRIATPVGGFPIKVRLIDAARTVRRELAVGKAIIGARDEIYYFGSASEADAEALGGALKTAGFLEDTGVSVVLAKGDGTAISFVVAGGVWERPEAVAGFESLVRRAAPSVGGLPIMLRLLNPEMEAKREVAVQ